MMQIKEIIHYLETVAPLSLQESYDNSGLIVGNPSDDVTGVLISLDSTEDIVQEAIDKNCNLIVAHHPIVFSGLKKINGKNYVERTIIKAIKNNIAIYACHTNLDNVLRNGVNQKIGETIGLKNMKVLVPKRNLLSKLITFVPVDHQEKVREAIFQAGAGQIGDYSHCSFNTTGEGTYKALEGANPYLGQIGEVHHEKEVKVEVIFPNYLQGAVVSALLKAHPYEEVAYDIISLNNSVSTIGSGVLGELPEEMPITDFLNHLKQKMQAGCIKYTEPHKETVKRIALCGGSGSFLLNDAKKHQADIFITSDYKYHQFFDAEGQIVIADIGHYESEQYTIDLFQELLQQQFEDLKIVKTSLNTNPVRYI